MIDFRIFILHIFLFFPLILVSFTANAYVGPGAGAGTIAVVLGIITSIILVLVAIIWYPFKRLINKLIKRTKESPKNNADEE